ncbi:MAG: DUF1329 domain-containing protein, partial [Rhodoferax sp.]|nr:DUF1329 domain-containing protein [Rhodoferax sp.]
MRIPVNMKTGAIALALALYSLGAHAGVSAEEASKLKGELTPLGAEKAGNKDGSIPAWTGGLTTPMPGFKNGGKRGDPFASDKPLYSVTVKNMAQYADKLTEGTKALLIKYPETYRVDVYATRRTAAAPQWVYDNTFKNATRAKIVSGTGGDRPEGAYGGVPFPIPKAGIEVLWNHMLRWRGESWHVAFNGWTANADGKRVLIQAATNDYHMPY